MNKYGLIVNGHQQWFEEKFQRKDALARLIGEIMINTIENNNRCTVNKQTMPGTNDSIVQYYLSCEDVSNRYIYAITVDMPPETVVNTKDSDVPVYKLASIYGCMTDRILNSESEEQLTEAVPDTITEKQEEKKEHDGKTVRSMVDVFHCTEDDIVKLKKAVDQYDKTYPGLSKLIVHDHNVLTDTDWERIAETCKSVGATGTYVLSASDGLVHVKSRSGKSGSALIL